MRNAFVKTLCNLAAVDKNIYLLTGDLGFGVLDKFAEKYPDNFINMGIAEQNMNSVAAGMSFEGKKIFTYSMANFQILRSLEQIRNDISYHNTDVKIVAIGAGFDYGTAGMTHHGTEDISVIRAIPNMTVFSPADIIETEAVMIAAYNIDKPCYIRLGKRCEKNIHTQTIKNYTIGKAIKIFDGDDVAIFSTGAISSEALKVAVKLNEMKIRTAFYTFPTIKPLDTEIIEEYARRCKIIVTVEENNIIGGFGSAVAEKISELDGRIAILKRIGIPDKLTSTVGNQNYLWHLFKMDAESIFNIIMEGEFYMKKSENNLNGGVLA